MSVLVVGVSHRTAPVEVLERLALDGDGVHKLLNDVAACDHVSEATVLATCNRLEVYADVERFHGSVEDISRLLCERADTSAPDLVRYLYVHYDDGAVSHLLHVAAGLDSMVVGEGQILGQTREALRLGQEHATVGPSLNLLFQQALRVGKRAHAETDIDHAAPSLVTAALDRAVLQIGPIAGKRAVVLGAGTMASLATSTLARLGAADISVVNRTVANADRLAEEYAARSVQFDRLTFELANADVVISCTGASGVVLTREQVATRAHADRPLAIIDLALPHDVDPWVVTEPGVTLIDLRSLAEDLLQTEAAREVAGVREIVAEEISAFVSARRQASVTPTVVALRHMATEVVDAELERLLARLPDLDPATRAEVEHAVRRVADKLLHQPTVRVKELANETGAVSYAAALAELFSLHPDAVEAVTRVANPEDGQP
jgi:glutamyl-tRNA reductase